MAVFHWMAKNLSADKVIVIYHWILGAMCLWMTWVICPVVVCPQCPISSSFRHLFFSFSVLSSLDIVTRLYAG